MYVDIISLKYYILKVCHAFLKILFIEDSKYLVHLPPISSSGPGNIWPIPVGTFFLSVQFSHSVVFDSLWPRGLQHTRLSLSITNSWSIPKLMSIESVMPSNHLILCGPLLPPSIFPSIRVFSNKSVLRIRWPKYWSFQFQHQSFQWIFRTDFL